MNTSLLGLALLGAAFSASLGGDDFVIVGKPFRRKDGPRKSNRSEQARINREKSKAPYYSAMANKGRGGIVNRDATGEKGSRAEVELAQRLAADSRISREIDSLRSAINRNKKTAARKMAQRLRLTVEMATEGHDTELARRVLEIAKGRGIA